ncbi:methyltransferase domain-containing protein [Sphingobacterium yanglingense]|uniref:Thiopurine S-methyltransferase n=1 Tax=Sphingobacterium yanglingense TaxID=1437280 RepID=A0A4R6WLJ2_9SPHI|nr:methyltransferase domain-containing protein [Sphingobacterium yanglingense]TDQ79658.1 thiopurine S-methyltransferase [Sphingobacterium yanglingense]
MEENIKLDAEYWEHRWKARQTGWDIGYPSRPIVHYMEQYPNKEAHILIPGCGNAYEADWLATAGFQNITVLDISSTAIASAKNKVRHAEAINFVCADFFTYQGQFDLIIEQTFFCAIPVGRRSDYARKTSELLVADGHLVGVLFDREFGYSGPPFGGHALGYEPLFKAYYTFERFEACYNSIDARAGTELFINLIKR